MLGFKLIGPNQVGIVTKAMFGKKMDAGQIIATKGEIGVQAETLRPGLYFRMPFIYYVQKAPVTRIEQGTVGIVESIDGQPIPTGRLLGNSVDCNSFQDAKTFLENGGCKGPQIPILRPGTYRINTQVFHITEAPVVSVLSDKIGVVTALDGVSLSSEYVIAPASTKDSQHFQDGQSFIDGRGFRGPQLETLQPGEYYINPKLFSVDQVDKVEVPPGYVAVVISSVGKDLEKPFVKATDVNAESTETPLITDKIMRGILREPVAPGKYNLNSLAYHIELVPTSAVTIDWASPQGVNETVPHTSANDRRDTHMQDVMNHYEESDNVAEFFKFGQLKVTSKDGFQLEVDVRLIIRISPANAPAVIARFGSVHNLVEQVVHPLIDSSFRNAAGNKAAMEFVHSRTQLQEDSLKTAREEFEKYHVEVQGLLIAYIKVDQQLLDTQTKKEIAVQQQKQYEEEAKTQEQRIAVAEKTARADKQKDVIAAKLSVEIAADNAQAAIKEAEGIRAGTKIKADGEAYQIQELGKAQAGAYQAQTDALGQENVALLKVMETIKEGNIKITPDIQVSGGSGEGVNSGLFNTFLAASLAKKKEST